MSLMRSKDNLYTIQENNNLQIVECYRNAKPGEIIALDIYISIIVIESKGVTPNSPSCYFGSSFKVITPN